MTASAGSAPGRRRLEGWQFIAWFLAAAQTTFFVVPQLRPGIAGVICWMFGSDQFLWLGLTGITALVGTSVSLWRRPFWSRSREISFLVLLILACSPLAFHTYPSSHDTSPSPIRFRLPLDGPVTVGWGGGTPAVNYHVAVPDQRWAYDLVVTRNGKSHDGDGTKCEDYYCYGLLVLAPADGVVHAVSDGDPDMPIGVMGGGKSAGGNEIELKVAENDYLFLCHMQPGSITVKPGDTVTAGQVVGRVGNSGNTSEPHLHIHLQRGPETDIAEGIPLLFHNYRVGEQVIERGLPTGGFDGEKFRGQIVEHVPQP